MMIKILSYILINLHQLSPPTVQDIKAVGYVRTETYGSSSEI